MTATHADRIDLGVARSRPGRGALAIGLDVGGTKIAGGVVTDGGQVVHDTVVGTPTSSDGVVTLVAIERLIKELRDRYPPVSAIGVGAAGMVEWPDGRIRFAPNNAYRELPLRAHLERATGLPTVVDNDANVAAWAEARFGVASNANHVVVLTVGTGIGGGLIVDGQLLRGSSGLGAEIGHLVVDPNGDRCGCGNRGCLEAMASGSALGRYGRQAAQAEAGRRLAQLAGGAELVSGVTVFQAALEGDEAARALFARLGFWLGVGVASLVNIFDPEMVIVGGGLAQTGELLLEPTRGSFSRFLFAPRHRTTPPIAIARLGSRTGLIGAAMLALDHSAGSRFTATH